MKKLKGWLRQNQALIYVALFALMLLLWNHFLYDHWNTSKHSPEKLHTHEESRFDRPHKWKNTSAQTVYKGGETRKGYWVLLKFGDIKDNLDDIMHMAPTWSKNSIPVVLMQYTIKYYEDKGEATFLGQGDYFARAPLVRLIQVIQQYQIEVIPSLQIRSKSLEFDSLNKLKASKQLAELLSTFNKLLTIHEGASFLHLDDNLSAGKLNMVEELFKNILKKRPELKYLLWSEQVKKLSDQLEERERSDVYGLSCGADTVSNVTTNFYQKLAITYMKCSIGN